MSTLDTFLFWQKVLVEVYPSTYHLDKLALMSTTMNYFFKGITWAMASNSFLFFF